MSNTLKTLSMDSSSPLGCVALLRGSSCLAQDHFQGPEGHSVLLPQKVTHLLSQTGYAIADLDLIVVSIGPGSFSGLRIVLGFALGIALVHQTPVIGISNLDLIAAASGRQQGWVSVVLDARRGEIFAALYRVENGETSVYQEPGLALSPEKWAIQLASMPELHHQSLCFTGSGLKNYATVFHGIFGTLMETTPETAWISDPHLLGTLGQKKLTTQGHTQTTTLWEPKRAEVSLLPDYQRRPEAEEKKHSSPCLPEK